MTKIIQPLSDPDEIREEANEQVKEKFTDFYVDATAPDPLDFQATIATQTAQAAQSQPDPTQTVAADAAANDPLAFTHPLVTQATAEQQAEVAEASNATANDPLAGTSDSA